MQRSLALFILVCGCSVAALARISVPEMEPASAGAALALISTGLLILRGRRRKS